MEKKTKLIQQAMNELDLLATIVKQLEKTDDAAKLRTFNYLKSRYSKQWPIDNL
jgi:hypothetical protein